MPEFRIDVTIDPSKAQGGRRKVSKELDQLEREAGDLRKALVDALSTRDRGLGKSLQNIEAILRRTEERAIVTDTRLSQIGKDIRTGGVKKLNEELRASNAILKRTEERALVTDARLSQLGKDIRTGNVRKLNDELRKTKDRAEEIGKTRGLRRFANRLRNVRVEASASQRAMSRLIVLFGGFQVVRGAIRTMADFEQSIATVQAVTRGSREQMALFSSTAQELGRTTRFTAAQSADALVQLSRAGFDVAESTAAVRGTLRLAQAAAIGLGEAAGITAATVRGFRLEATETGRAVDVMALVSSRANTTVTQLGEGLKFVAPVAAGLNVSLEQTSAAMGVLSDAGLQATLAGTGLRRVMAALEAPTKAASVILGELGVKAEEVKVSQVGLVAAIERLATAGLDTGKALTLFGQRGGPAFEVLASNIPRIRELTGELEKAEGVAEQMAQTMDDTLAGAAKRTISAMQDALLQLAEGNDVLRNSLEGLTDAFNFLSEAMGSGLRAAEAEAALAPVGAEIVRIKDQIRDLEKVGQNQGFLSDSQTQQLARLRTALAGVRDGHKEATVAAREAGEAEVKAAKDRALAAALAEDAVLGDGPVGPDGGPARDPFAEQAASLREQNELLTVRLALGARAAEARAIEQEIERETGEKILPEQREAIRAIVDEKNNLIETLERQRDTENRVRQEVDAEAQAQAALAEAQRSRIESMRAQLDVSGQLKAQEEELLALRQTELDLIPEIDAALLDLRMQQLEASNELGAGFERALLRIKAEAEDLAAVGDQIVGTFADRATNAITQFVETGKFSFRDFTSSILSDLTKILTRLLIVQSISAAFGALGGGAVGTGVNAASGALNAGRAGGGTVQPGQKPMPVGENGPELFVPDRTGTIVPNGEGAQAPAPNVNLQAVVVEDAQMVPNAISGGDADDVLIIRVGENRDRFRQALGI